tara:strand:+ start:389 stop:619 length:231 start_codon:yes stop_codon:yes gene_type:complete
MTNIEISGTEVAAAVALALQAFALEIENSDSFDRQSLANRLRAIDASQQPAVAFALSMFSMAVGAEGPKPPELRLV